MITTGQNDYGLVRQVGQNGPQVVALLPLAAELQEISLMETVAVPAEPTLPFLRMNRYHIAGFNLDDPYDKKDYELSIPKMRRSDFEDGRFKEDACIIDINCWKFPIRDVVSLGPSRDFWEIIWRKDRVKVQYIYDTPIKLTFDEAREEIVELICSKRWFSKTQDRESEKQFRERSALCENMRDLIIGRQVASGSKAKYHWIGGISHYGEWVG
jgi:hypothetical protein